MAYDFRNKFSLSCANTDNNCINIVYEAFRFSTLMTLLMRIDRHLRREPALGASPQIPKRPKPEFLEIGKIPSVLRLYSNEGHLPENAG
jgi:hypothetical protein